MKKNKLLFKDGETEWSFSLLEKLWERIEIIGTKELGLDVYPSQIQIISSDQMLDNYSQGALPINYSHWSFGKSFIKEQNTYKKGQSGLAYEVVINTNPCIAYLMETNTVTMQALVLAHASIGHNNVFKTNYLFKEWSDADTILEYLKYARDYIAQCEEKYGFQEVEILLDACHSLQMHGVDKYKKPKHSLKVETEKRKARSDHEEASFRDIWRTIKKNKEKEKKVEDCFSKVRFPEENLLYFIEKYSPVLKEWQREIVRIVRKIAQYYYPQMQTHLLHEGAASFVHHTIMTMMFDQGYIGAGAYLEFIKSHTGVTFQPTYEKKYYSGINVYALGFAMFKDVQRMCQNPDAEDLRLFPDICNTDWLTTYKNIVANYRDESFVLQFLGPKVVRQFNLFSVDNDSTKTYHHIGAVQDAEELHEIREALSSHYDLSKRLPQLEVVNVDWEGDRTLNINHYVVDDRLLDHSSAVKTWKYLNQLWGHDVRVHPVDKDGEPI